MKYVHGYDLRENRRLQDQANTLVELQRRAGGNAMIEGIRNAALKAGIVDQIIFDKGIQDLYRTIEADGVFCYTFFKAIGTKP